MNESVAAVQPAANNPPAECRDLEADLAYCQAADDIAPFVVLDHKRAAEFIAGALVGWPYAIRRAVDAEKEIDRLHNELQMYQEQERSRRGSWD